MSRRERQLDLDLRRWGGRRRGAGRKPQPGRRRVAHRPRQSVTRHAPVLVTQRLCAGLPSLRERGVFDLIWRILQEAHEQFGGRLVHYSFQTNHVHMLVEAESPRALARFMAGLKIRIARALNKLLGRKGPVFCDRYHSRTLLTPSEVKNAIAYVINNDLRHTRSRATVFDYFSSAPFFAGWVEGRVSWPKPIVGLPPCVPARSWLLSEGWRRAGEVSLNKIPGPPG